MTDYPGQTLRRFGRYQAVESIGHAGLTQLWRAWDPYLERFVVVAVLHGEDPAHVRTRIPDLGNALHHWTGGKYGAASHVLDLELGGEETKPFVVLAIVEDDDSKRSLQPADSVRSRAGTLWRHWDLLAAAGGMLLAGVLAWMLQGVFPSSTEPPVARPPGTAVAAADGQRQAPASTTPTTKERVAPPPSTATALPAVAAAPTPMALPVGVLVERWLARHCKGVEDRYEERGREHWSCSWQDVQISGSLPALEVEFTRIDRAAGGGSGAALELLAREQFRLTCADDGCRRLHAVPTSVKGIAAGAATPTKARPRTVTGESQNRAPIVEILAAPRRVVPGERVILKARVTDPDSSNGDQIECTWSVDGRAVARLCWELVWTVPTTQSYGNIVFKLEARDRQGATDSEFVSVSVGPRRALGQPR